MKYKTITNGFTLLEVLIALAIIGILAAVAIPSYSEHIKRTHLNNAAQKAEHLQMLLNDYWEDNETYTDLPEKLGWHPGDSGITSTIEAGPDNNIKTSFKITISHKNFPDEPVIIQYTRD